MRNGAVVLSLLLVAGVLAGCVGGGDAEDVDPPTASATATATQDSGAISGLITDEEGLPVAEAQVALIDADLEAMTDGAGTFTFNNLSAGSHKLIVQKLGYESVARTIEVALGEVTQVELTLAAVQVGQEPYVVPMVFEGIIQCSTNPYYPVNVCDGVTGEDTSLFFLEIDESQAEWEEAVIELVWTPTTAATGQALEIDVCDVQNTTTAQAYCSDSEHYWEFEGGESPLVMRLDDLPLEETNLYQVGIGADWLSPYPAVQQRFTLYIGLCYWDDCDGEYTGIPPE